MWLCPKCGGNNVNQNIRCANYNCRIDRPKEVNLELLDCFDELLSDIRQHEVISASTVNIPEDNVSRIVAAVFTRNRELNRPEVNMTPQEELFSKLFNHEKVLVKDMDTLMLRAHREELANIAFEARARLTAVDDEERQRKKKISDDGKPTGFERSVNTDETTTNAINTIKERQKRMSKTEKIQASLEKLGISTTDAVKLMSAGTILGRIKQKASELDGVKPEEVSESKPVFNPFEKKEG